MERERKVNPSCVNAKNPFHECADYCGQRSHYHHQPPKLAIAGAKSQVLNGEGRVVDPSCVNASNPFHQCADYCAKKTAEAKRQSKSNSGRFAFPVLLKVSPKSSSQGSSGGKSVLNGVRGKNVDPNCPNASNPFHECGDYCKEKTTDVKKQILAGKTVRNGELSKAEVRKKEEGRRVDPTCVNASNAFHQCTENCSQRTPGAKSQSNGCTLGDLIAIESEKELATRENGKEESVIRENKKEELAMRENKVDPRCPNASNPFHECAEYCIQKISGSGRSEKGRPAALVADRSKGSMNIVSEKRGVDPRCINAANPFHECAEYCSQKIREAA